MKKTIAIAGAGTVAAFGIFAGIALTLGSPGAAEAGDPSPPAGMHQACDRMNDQAMERMHTGMMHAGGQMGDWMASAEQCHQ